MVDFSIVILSFFGGVTGMSSPSHVNKNCHGTVKYSGAFPGRQSPKACLAVFAGRNTRERTFKKSLKKLKVSEDCKYLYIHIHIYQMHVYMHISMEFFSCVFSTATTIIIKIPVNIIALITPPQKK